MLQILGILNEKHEANLQKAILQHLKIVPKIGKRFIYTVGTG